MIEIAQAWQRGDLPLPGVRTSCTGFDRFVAMAHARSDDRVLVKSLLDALSAALDEDEDARMTKHGRFSASERRQFGGVLTVRNGTWVLIWPEFTTSFGFRYRVSEGVG